MVSIAEAARDNEYFRVIDVAHRIAGIGSIAFPRYVVLVEGRGSPDRNVLIDLKLAHPSSIATLRANRSGPMTPSALSRCNDIRQSSHRPFSLRPSGMAPAIAAAKCSRRRIECDCTNGRSNRRRSARP